MPKKESSVKKSIPHKFKFLLDANISRKVGSYFSSKYNLDCKHISHYSNQSLSDQEIVEIAKKEKRVIITHDLDFGEIYYLKEQGKIGVLMLRLKNQTSDHVTRKLNDFLMVDRNINLSQSLIIISDENIRVFSPEEPSRKRS